MLLPRFRCRYQESDVATRIQMSGPKIRCCYQKSDVGTKIQISIPENQKLISKIRCRYQKIRCRHQNSDVDIKNSDVDTKKSDVDTKIQMSILKIRRLTPENRKLTCSPLRLGGRSTANATAAPPAHAAGLRLIFHSLSRRLDGKASQRFSLSS